MLLIFVLISIGAITQSLNCTHSSFLSNKNTYLHMYIHTYYIWETYNIAIRKWYWDLSKISSTGSILLILSDIYRTMLELHIKFASVCMCQSKQLKYCKKRKIVRRSFGVYFSIIFQNPLVLTTWELHFKCGSCTFLNYSEQENEQT